MKKTLLACLLLTATTAGAVKMQPGRTVIKQSDGTSLTIRAIGDENLCYFLTDDGTILYQQGTDFFVANIGNDGILSPSRILAHEPDLRDAAEKKAISAQDKSLFFEHAATQARANRTMREPMAEDKSLMPHLGKQKIPVILVEFSDVPFTVATPKETFNKYLNGKELFNENDDPEMGYFTAKGSFVGNYGSVGRYFSDMSFGMFQPEFDLYGPVKLDKPLRTYGAGYSSQEDMKALFTDACTAADGELDFSQYDSNGDGNVDLVYIIYAGYSQSIAGNSTDCIHPKSGVTSLGKTFDGKSIVRYGVNNELNGTPETTAQMGTMINGIGLFCHEFSHCLGLPDLYPSPGSTAEQLTNQNMDYWSLMDAGEYTYNGYRPTEYTAWERERMEWMKIDTLSKADDVELLPLSDGGKAYRIINDNDKSGHEYYIVENVQKKGWNKSIMGSGMMVTHVDYDDYYFSLGGCKTNSTVGHPRMTLMPADGLFVPEYYVGSTIKESSDDIVKKYNTTLVEKYDGQEFTSATYRTEAAGDVYPGNTGATELTDTSSPTKAWVFTGDTMGKPITDIAMDSETGVVSFKFMGGKTDGIAGVLSDKTSPTDIYTLSGVRITGDIKSLPKGIYITGGKKIVKD